MHFDYGELTASKLWQIVTNDAENPFVSSKHLDLFDYIAVSLYNKGLVRIKYEDQFIDYEAITIVNVKLFYDIVQEFYNSDTLDNAFDLLQNNICSYGDELVYAYSMIPTNIAVITLNSENLFSYLKLRLLMEE